MSQSLEDRAIIVTGGGSGIGRQACLTLAAAQANVIIADLDPQGGAAVASEIASRGGSAMFLEVDVTDEQGVKDLVSTVVERYGRLDGAFNNAGVEHHYKPLHELSSAEWRRVIDIDLTGVFLCMKYEIAAMLASGGGSIVNAASGAGAVAVPLCGEYVAAKHGVVGLTKSGALDYAQHGIRVNAVLPGMIATEMVERRFGGADMAEALQQIMALHPIGRLGKPLEVAEAVKWLLSDASSFVTGVSLPIDGGFLVS